MEKTIKSTRRAPVKRPGATKSPSGGSLPPRGGSLPPRSGSTVLIGGEPVTAISFKGDPQRQLDRRIKTAEHAEPGHIPVFDGACGDSLRDSGYTVEALLGGASGGTGGGGGTPGAPGAPGKSAYQSYLEAGGTLSEEAWAASLNRDDTVVPAVWQSHLDQKIAAIRTLQDDGGKDCFSFIVMTDMHYPSNPGKNAPLLAKRIMDECDIKYALCLGDTQTRGCWATKEQLLAENEAVTEMLRPIGDRLLRTQGNHDGNYGTLNGETYAYRLTPAEMYNHIYRKVGKYHDCHFDASGTGYWVDDTAAKVRYIVLNCHNTKYETNADGTQKYPNMSQFRFCQSQYDLVIEALNGVPDEDYTVIVAGHVALGINGGHSQWGSVDTDGNGTKEESTADCTLMNDLLAAYKNRSTFSGEFAGTADTSSASAPTVEYTNLFDKNGAGFVGGSRFGNTGTLTVESGTAITNYIPYDPSYIGKALHIKGIATSVNGGSSYCRLVYEWEDGLKSVVQLPTNKPENFVQSSYDQTVAVFTFDAVSKDDVPPVKFRIGGKLSGSVDDIVITLDENIQTSAPEAPPEYGYDHVSVDVDFTEAKGQIVGFFGGHTHSDLVSARGGINRVTTRSDAKEENVQALKDERVAGTATEQSFDVFTVNKAKSKVYATKIGAGEDRMFTY